jgi:hypothetical protein
MALTVLTVNNFMTEGQRTYQQIVVNCIHGNRMPAKLHKPSYPNYVSDQILLEQHVVVTSLTLDYGAKKLPTFTELGTFCTDIFKIIFAEY